jgi:tryptophan-rich sensory protein
VQLVLNALWSWIFFGLRAPGVALVEILVLLLAIAATMAAGFRSHPLAAWLLAPYLSWVAFAAALNAAIWCLN